MVIKPYKFNLKKVSGHEVRLIRAINSFLPMTGLVDSFKNGVKEALARYLGEDISLYRDAVYYEPFQEFLAGLPGKPITAIIGINPIKEKCIVEIDAPLALMAVEKLLGGRGDVLKLTRELTDTEQGVLEYLIVELLSHVHTVCGSDERVHMRFEKFACSGHEVRDVTGGSENVAVLVFRINMGKFSGFVRLVLPDPFISEGILNAIGSEEDRTNEIMWIRLGLNRFGYVKTQLWAEAGRATVMPEDLKDLEDGDVVIFDHSSLHLGKEGVGGKAVLRVGHGLNAGLDADLKLADAKVYCTITGVHEGE